MGKEAVIEIIRFFEIRLDTVEGGSGMKGGGERKWVIVSYVCAYCGGSLCVCEPGKNDGFEYIDVFSVDDDRLSSSSSAAIEALRANWSDVCGALDAHASRDSVSNFGRRDTEHL